MSASYLVDTDVLVDFLRGVPPAVEFVTRNADRIALSAIVLSELYAGAREDEIADLDDFVANLPVLAIGPEIARAAGLLRHRYGKSHGVSLADALLAATATHHGLDVKTLNTKHFPMFNGLQPAYRK